MKVCDKLRENKGKTLFSIEILPPLKGENLQTIFSHLDPLVEHDLSFINVTYHREEFYYKEMGHGFLQRQVIRKRPGTVGICAAIQNKYGIDAIPHVLCGGFSKEDTENLLIDLDFLGIENVLALRGDAVKSERYFQAEEDGHAHAESLILQIKAMNDGKYLNDYMQNTNKTQFCIGAACYPEKHAESPSLEQDIHYLKQKVAAGAEYLVTQMFFDNKKYFDFVARCRKEGISIPIIPGLKPLTTMRQINVLPQQFHVDLPDELVREVVKCSTNADVKKLGIEWCIEQSKQLRAAGVPMLHYYSMGKSDEIKQIVTKVW